MDKKLEILPEPPIRVGISTCLLGENVRFDGGHKLNTLITGLLGEHFTWIPVCPEIELGLGAPRESMRLIGSPGAPRLVTQKSGKDYTDAMKRWAEKRVRELKPLGLHGYILKKDSPSCGMERVKVYGKKGMPQRKGMGIWAEVLMRHLPLLPVEEEGRLHDPLLRENFVERVFACYRWSEFVGSGPRPADLVQFHTRQKLTLQSHSEPHYRKLGRMVAQAGTARMKELLEQYGGVYMEGLCVKASPSKHSNVLYHIVGFLKKQLGADDKAELVETIESYRKCLVPLVVPMTLIRHHLRGHPVPWVCEQTYLHPYPAELMLRNRV